MHSCHGIWQFIVQVFIDVTSGVSHIMREIISVHIVIMKEHSSVHVLRFEIEPNIVPVSRLYIMVRNLLVSEVCWQWKRQVSSF